MHGDPYHDHHSEGNHDESWHEDGQYWHDGHEDDPHHGMEDHDPHHGMESDHAEPEDLSAPEKPEEESPAAKSAPIPEEDIFVDEEACAPSGPIVDLNYATLEELMTLPGVGPKLAESIIDHRPFETFDDVEIVPGLGSKKLNEMIDRLMLG